MVCNVNVEKIKRPMIHSKSFQTFWLNLCDMQTICKCDGNNVFTFLNAKLPQSHDMTCFFKNLLSSAGLLCALIHCVEWKSFGINETSCMSERIKSACFVKRLHQNGPVQCGGFILHMQMCIEADLTAKYSNPLSIGQCILRD